MKNYKILLAVLLFVLLSLNFTYKASQKVEDKELISMLISILSQAHYQPEDIDDDFSESIYDNFIEKLDGAKQYLTLEDFKIFEGQRLLLDDQIKNEDISFYKTVLSIYKNKMDVVNSMYKDILSRPFDFNLKETVILDLEMTLYAKNNIELKEYWRKDLKLSVLSKVYDALILEDDKFKEDDSYDKKTLKELEKEIREKTLENLEDLYLVFNEITKIEWFSVYLNSITEVYDPHTNYLEPLKKKSFDDSMSGKIEGIGARLQREKGYTKVIGIVYGGPAYKEGSLEVGDIILESAQGEAEFKNLVGMRLKDAIEYIKGKKGTIVRLKLKKIDGRIEIISIVRDIIELEETFVKSSVVKVLDKKFAVINLPKFYINFRDDNYRNSYTDMAEEIETLKKEGVDGLLIDLRNNGGGSLKTAIEIGGLFIDRGPIVQVKYNKSEASIRQDKDERIQWKGPLVILVNELSASASEIFAAAMQDYNRAVIIGSKQTFGKGTVQNLLSLNQIAKSDNDLGGLKLTIQKFYRINGGSTQIKGVESDISMPSRYTYMKIGEKDQKNALVWDKIEKANYIETNTYSNKEQVVLESQERIADNEKFRLIDQYARWLVENSKKESASLNFEEFTISSLKLDKEAEKFKNIYEYESGYSYSSTKTEELKIENDSIMILKRERWHKSLSKDIYVSESIKVLSQLKLRKKYIDLVEKKVRL